MSSDFATVAVLWQRDLKIFFRQTSRIAGALLQPLLFWLVLGFGLSPSFALAGSGLDYRAYFFPGVVMMIVLFTSIFQTLSVIEDRREGFLQGVLAGPGSRFAIVLGKTFGSATVGLIETLMFLLLAPVAGFPWNRIEWPFVIAVTALTGCMLSAVGFIVAWWLESIQGYHVVMTMLLFPLWLLSGAVFPPAGIPPALAFLVRWNPFSPAICGLRRALHGGELPLGSAVSDLGAWGEIGVLALLTGIFLAIAGIVARRHE